jgi:hypothetical protein
VEKFSLPTGPPLPIVARTRPNPVPAPCPTTAQEDQVGSFFGPHALGSVDRADQFDGREDRLETGTGEIDGDGG